MRFFGKEFGRNGPDSHPADTHIRRFFTESGVDWMYNRATDEYRLDLSGTEFSFYPDNARKHFLQTESIDELLKYVAMAIALPPDETLSFSGTLYLKFRPIDASDFELPLTHVERSQQIGYGLVYEVISGESQGHIVWATEDMLVKAGMTWTSATELALANLDRALDLTEFENLDIAGRDVYTVTTPLLFKSCIVLAPSIKSRLEPLLGWPVCLIMPHADYLSFMSFETLQALPGAGRVVIEQFLESPHALSHEFFELNDKGMEAIGRFSRSQEN